MSFVLLRPPSRYRRIRAIYARGVTGNLSEPWNQGTLFQDSAGTTPVTAVEQGIGLELDTSQGMALGPGLWSSFGIITAPWTNVGGGVYSIDGSQVGNTDLSQNAQYSVNTFYATTFTLSGVSGGTITVFAGDGTGAAYGNGTHTIRQTASQAYLIFRAPAGVAATLTVSSNSVRTLAGNHLIQATGAAEPMWSKRYNLLTYSEQFDNAAWARVTAAVTANAAIAPDGTLTADKFVPNNLEPIAYFARTVFPTVIGTYTASIYAKQGELTKLRMDMYSTEDGNTSSVFDLALGVVESGTGTIQAIGNGWYRLSQTKTWTGLTSAQVQYVRNTVVGDGTSGLYVWGAQLDYGTVAKPYQRIAAATDYDTAGFLPYEKYDGLDDSVTCATGGGSSTAFSLQAAIMLEGAAAAQTIFSDAGANIGLKIERDASNQIVFSGGTGVAFVPATSAALTVGVAYIITCTYDGTTLSIQINNGTPVTATCALSAGTAGFTVGKANGAASSYLLGRRYGMIYAGKNYLMSDAEKLAGKQLLAAKAGITL